MWSEWDSIEVLEDFKQMSAAGLDLVRFFVFTPDFVSKGKVDPLQLQHFNTLLKHLETAKLYAIPTLFVGHMSGQNYRVAGWDESTFFSDPTVLEEQKSFIKAILELSIDSDFIAGWCLSNEMPNDFPGAHPEEVTGWFTEISHFIKELDSRPLIFGDGVWSPEITGHGGANHLEPSAYYRLQDLAPLQDTLGVHFYPRFDDYWPQAYTPGFRLLMAGSWKDSIFLEEFGNSVAMSSEANQALYFRGVLFSTLQVGATAALSWCWTDFDLPDLRPYLHNTFEMRFGLRRGDGSFRPALKELQDISQLSRELTEAGWELAPRQDLVIIPANFYAALPFDWDRDTDTSYTLYLHTYGALASAGASPVYGHEPAVEHRRQDHENHYTRNASFGQTPTTLWFAALKRLSAPFWKLTLDTVSKGTTLYASFATDHWIIDLDETLGIESRLRFGLPEFYPDEVLSISSPCGWGLFGESTFDLNLGTHGHTRSVGYLPANVLSAEVLLEDAKHRPLLIRKQHGAGTIYFSLFPFEVLMTLSCDEAVRSCVTRIYASILEEKSTTVTTSSTPAGEFLRFERKNEIKEYLFNHAWEERVFSVRLKNKDKTIKSIRVELPPKSFCEIVHTAQDAANELEFA